MNSALQGGKKSERGLHYGWIILGVGVLTTLSAIGLARFGYTMILPSMQDGLRMSNTQTGGLATGNFCGYLGLALVGGFLASHFSVRRVITISLFTVGFTMILTGLSNGFLSALLWRALTGMGSGGSNVPVMGLMAAWFASKRRGLAAGVAVTGSSVGLIITGPLVPAILNTFGENGWRCSWFVLGGLVLVFAFIAHLFLRDRPEELGLVPIGGENSEHLNERKRPESGFRAWGLVYKSRTVWQLSMVYAAFGFSYIIFVTFFAKYLQDEVGLSKESAGRWWQVVGWLSLFCGVLWGWISDCIGRRLSLTVVCLIQMTAYLLFALMPEGFGLATTVLLFGLTAWSVPAIMASACGDQVGAKLAPAALGFVTLFMGIGQAIGPSVAGGIADRAGSFVVALVIAAGAAFLGAVASFLLPGSLRRHSTG